MLTVVNGLVITYLESDIVAVYRMYAMPCRDLYLLYLTDSLVLWSQLSWSILTILDGLSCSVFIVIVICTYCIGRTLFCVHGYRDLYLLYWTDSLVLCSWLSWSVLNVLDGLSSSVFMVIVIYTYYIGRTLLFCVHGYRDLYLLYWTDSLVLSS